jgi:hypothetical protein
VTGGRRRGVAPWCGAGRRAASARLPRQQPDKNCQTSATESSASKSSRAIGLWAMS